MLCVKCDDRDGEPEDEQEEKEVGRKKAGSVQAKKPQTKKPEPLATKEKPKESEAPGEKSKETPAEKAKDTTPDKSKTPRGEMTATTKPDKGHSGDIEIEDIALDARCITLSNHGQNPQPLDGWKIVRSLDKGARIVQYEFPSDAIIKPGLHLKVNLGIHFCFYFIDIQICTVGYLLIFH